MKLRRSRRGWPWLVVTCLMLASLLPAGAAPAAYVPNSLGYVPNEYIIQAVAGSSMQAVSASVSLVGGTLTKVMPLPDTYLVTMGTNGGSAGGTRTMAGRSAWTPWVIQSFCPNAIYRLDAVPNDELWTDLWGMKSINMPQAWDIQKGSASVTVAVIDSGTANHPDLVGRLVPGYDFIDNDADASNDLSGHGTHVAGTIAAQGDNTIGVVGVCWNGVNIMPIRVFGTGLSTTDIIIAGEDYAWRQRQDVGVVNMSYGGYPGYADPIERAMIQKMAADGMILCASAGNDGYWTPPWVEAPALFEEVIAVAAIGPDDQIAGYSSWGPGNEVDIAAPGGDYAQGGYSGIWSTYVWWDAVAPVYDYMPNTGTSMACPHVAGAAALLLSANIPASEVRSRLEGTARRPRTGAMDKKKYGAGILDVNAALANGSIMLVKPTKGATANAYPDFKINVRGIDPTSIAIYLDYADANGDGIPDNTANEAPALAGIAASGYLNATQTSLAFNWVQISPNAPLAPGLHFVYVNAQTTVGADMVYDWGTFTVASKTISAGQHLLALPYGLTTTSGGKVTVTAWPSDILLDASTSRPLDFRVQIPDRARLIRWSAAQSMYLSYVTGLVDPASNTPRPDDRAWLNPMTWMLMPDETRKPVSGFLPQDPNTVEFPAGTGFWLILQEEAAISSAFTEISATQGFSIYLYKGWNLIGNPYIHQVPLTAVHLAYQGAARTLDEDRLSLKPWVDPNFYGYKSGSGYELVPTERRLLEPYQGYWVRSLVGGISPQESLVMTVF